MKIIHPAHIIFVLLLLLGAAMPEATESMLSDITHRFVKSFGWLVLLACGFFVLLCVFLAFSPYGAMRLGGIDEPPQYSRLSWLAMLFTTGMGAGLVFYGAAEPLMHFIRPSPLLQAADSSGAARDAIAITLFHWCIHAWAVYAIAALAVAYFTFCRHTPLLPSIPISRRPFIATGIDSIAIIAVVFGLVASLSQGILHLASGASFLLPGIEMGAGAQIAILALLCICFMLSAVGGIRKSIRLLSNLNLYIAAAFLLYVIIAGPTLVILQNTIAGIIDYIRLLPALSFSVPPFSTTTRWGESWTITYLLWWIAWGPFVGVFIARISRGRTIREFILGVMLVPCLFSIVWFSALGSTSIHFEQLAHPGFAEVTSHPERAVYTMLKALPLADIMSAATVVLMFIFLITSADSGVYVLGMFSTQGALHPSLRQRLFWGAVITLITAGALLTGKGTSLFKSIAVFGGIPYLFILLLQIFGLCKALRQDKRQSSSDNGFR